MTDQKDTTKPHYVYAHCYEGNIFYIGRGQGRRADNFTSRSPVWLAFAESIDHDIQVLIMNRFKTVDAADRYEKKKIKEFNPKCNICHTDNPPQKPIRVSDILRICEKSGDSLSLKWLPIEGMWVIRYGRYEKNIYPLPYFSVKQLEKVQLSFVNPLD